MKPELHDIAHEERESRGRYYWREPGGLEAELTYSKAGDHLIIIDHTGVPRELAGKGIGQALVERAVADARASGKSILPLCPYAAAQFRRHPEWSDLLQKRREA